VRIGVLIVVFASCAAPVRSGTCFFVSPSGVALTSAHVVDDPYVHVRDALGARSRARVIARDRVLDIAALQVYGENTPGYLPIAADDAGLGERVYTIDKWTKEQHSGLVVGLRALGSEHLLSTTAHVARGSSGGPLVNAGGEVIGLLVRLQVENKIAFAVKSSTIRTAFRHLSPPVPKLDREHAIERARSAVCTIVGR
jgi:serine protease Do